MQLRHQSQTAKSAKKTVQTVYITYTVWTNQAQCIYVHVDVTISMLETPPPCTHYTTTLCPGAYPTEAQCTVVIVYL